MPPCSKPQGSSASVTRLRVMTLNIWNYNDPWQVRCEMIAKCINQVAPDIVGLQEIRVERDRSSEHQAQQIMAHMRDECQCVYRPAMTFDREPLREEGLAILSRWPIASWGAAELTRDAADDRDIHQRILLRADVGTPGSVLHFFNTHWSLSEAARRRNAAEVRAAIAQLVGTAPVVLVGDLNSPPDGPAATLFEPADSGDALLRDAWADLRPDDPGFTIKSDKPTHRIDYIAHNLDGGRFGRLIGVQLVATEPTNGVFPSDHIGIIADFEMMRW